MLTRFFSQSKPIQLVFLLAYLGLSYGMYAVFHFSELTFLNSFLGGIAILSCAFLIDFIVKKNKFQEQHSYSLLMFCVLCNVNQVIFKSPIEILGLLFILLALRRLLSLKSQIDISKKLFDAGFWVFWAVLCNPTHWLLLLLILVAAVFYAGHHFKYFLLGFLGFVCGLILHLATALVFEDTAPNYLNLLPNFDFKIDLRHDLPQLINLYVLIVLGIVLVIFMSPIYRPLKLNQQRNLSLLLISLILYTIYSLFSANFKPINFMFISLGLAFLTGNILQIKGLKLIYKELFLWLMIGLGIFQFSLV